jgi:hypothetical protein
VVELYVQRTAGGSMSFYKKASSYRGWRVLLFSELLSI